MKRRHKDEPYEDDGRTIADMNVDGMPWYHRSMSDRQTAEHGGNPSPMTKEEQRMYTWAAIKAGLLIVLVFAVVFGLFIALALIICYLKAKETAVGEGVQAEDIHDDEIPVPFGEALKSLFGNKYWVMILIMNFCANISYGISGASGTYYCKWIYGDDNLVAIQGAIGMIPTLLGFIAVGPMSKRLGVTKTLRVSFMIGAIGTALRLFNPTHFVYNTTLSCFATFANIPMMCLMGVMSAMAIDYNEYKYGRRMVATAQSACSFGNKVGSGIGASIIGWCLGLAAYDGLATTVSPAVIQAIYTFSIYIPLILFIVLFVFALRFDLEKRLPEIHKQIAARK